MLPPGHGDFYQYFSNSGLLDEFIEQVSNNTAPLVMEGSSVIHGAKEPIEKKEA